MLEDKRLPLRRLYSYRIKSDYDAVPLFSKMGYPWADNILAPSSCPTGPDGSNWERKTIHYDGYHELAYLHPARFKPDKSVLKNKIDFFRTYIILRFAKLTAHHDKGKTGITTKSNYLLMQLRMGRHRLYRLKRY